MKSHQLSHLAAQLKTARERKGLSQRALADKVGLPQGHLSRIERGEVDLQTSNLLELARVLDLELALVPRRALPAIEALSKQEASSPAEHDLRLSAIRQQASRLARKFPATPTLERLSATLNDLQEPILNMLSASEFKEALSLLERTRRILHAISKEPETEPLRLAFIRTVEALEQPLRNTRNRVVHGQAARPATLPAAYALNDDEEPTDVR